MTTNDKYVSPYLLRLPRVLENRVFDRTSETADELQRDEQENAVADNPT